MGKSEILQLPNRKKDLIFSTKEEDCKAICFFDIIAFSNKHGKNEYNFGVHVPVILEEDNLYYALGYEIGQVAYGSSISNAIKRMASLLGDFMDLWIKGDSDWEVLLSNPLEEEYIHLFHRVQKKMNMRHAYYMNILLSNTKHNKKITVEESIRLNIKSEIYEIQILERYRFSA